MMTLVTPDARTRRKIAAAVAGNLTPAQLTMARELLSAERPGRNLEPEDLLFWVRGNMPEAAARIESILYPAD
jgi:hypothetical protein